MAEKVHKLHKPSSHSAPYKPHRVGTRKHFFGSKSKKTKRFMIFDPKKGGVIFSTFFDPPPFPQNLKKVGFKWGGLGGVRTKNSLGDAFIGQNNEDGCQQQQHKQQQKQQQLQQQQQQGWPSRIGATQHKSPIDTRWTHARHNDEPYICGMPCEVCNHKKSMCQRGPQIWVRGTSEPPPNVPLECLGWRPTLNE